MNTYNTITSTNNLKYQRQVNINNFITYVQSLKCCHSTKVNSIANFLIAAGTTRQEAIRRAQLAVNSKILVAR